jgi:uncharacterized membrane protein YjgN (DUF898 family)
MADMPDAPGGRVNPLPENHARVDTRHPGLPTERHTRGAGGAMVTGDELPVRFTASGSEYFRLWVVNLLLTLVTFGIYYPWAKVRKLRYFYGNTWVGDHALDFHGDPRRMLRGAMLVGVLFIAYSAAGQFSPHAGLVALAILAAVWPALFRASMRFRLANTSWRGLRLHFTGDMVGAYKALLPALIPALLVVGLSTLLPHEAAPEAPADAAAAAEMAWVNIALATTMLGLLALLPFLLWNVKRYQHDHYALGRVQTQLRTGPGSFYLLALKTFGILLATSAVVGLLAVAITLGGGAMPGRKGGSVFTVVLMVLLIGSTYIAFFLVGNTFVASRLQNMLWNRTKSTEVRFDSQLRLAPLLLLTLKNWVLIALTLGLYWPFAAVASARMKLEAVTLHTRRPVDDLIVRANRAGESDATGDVAGDLFGLDFGF